MSWAEVDVIKKAINNHSVVKSVQTGSIAISGNAKTGTATINAVNPNKSVIIPNGFGLTSVPSNNTSPQLIEQGKGYFTLTNSTTVTATRFYASMNYDGQACFTVVEYY